jgi:hypothetical protein
MRAEDADHVQYRLSQAQESLGAGKLMLDHGHLSAAVSILYHGCFCAVWGLLLTEGKSSSKHSGMRSLFDQLWVNTGRVPVETGRFYRRLFQRRQRNDYGDLVTFENSEVEGLLAGAQEFVKIVSEKAREKLTDD